MKYEMVLRTRCGCTQVLPGPKGFMRDYIVPLPARLYGKPIPLHKDDAPEMRRFTMYQILDATPELTRVEFHEV